MLTDVELLVIREHDEQFQNMHSVVHVPASGCVYCDRHRLLAMIDELQADNLTLKERHQKLVGIAESTVAELKRERESDGN